MSLQHLFPDETSGLTLFFLSLFSSLSNSPSTATLLFLSKPPAFSLQKPTLILTLQKKEIFTFIAILISFTPVYKYKVMIFLFNANSSADSKFFLNLFLQESCSITIRSIGYQLLQMSHKHAQVSVISFFLEKQILNLPSFILKCH